MPPCGQITGKQLVSQLHWPAKNVLLQLEIRISSNSKMKKVSFEQVDFIPRGGGSILLRCPILGLGRKVAAQILSQFVRFSTTNIFTFIVCQILHHKHIYSRSLSGSPPQIYSQEYRTLHIGSMSTRTYSTLKVGKYFKKRQQFNVHNIFPSPSSYY